MNNRIVPSALIGVVLLGVGTGRVFAQTTTPSVKHQAVCQRVTNRLNALAQNGSTRITNRQQHVANVKVRWQERVNKWKSKGLDTTKVESDFVELGSLLDTWVTDSQTGLTHVQAALTYPCGDSQGQFKAALSKVRDDRKKLHTDRENIRTFYKNTLKPDLEALRQQAKAE